MTHPEERLTGYVDGTLATDERAEVDAHLATCATCREEVELATQAVVTLRELPEEPVPFGLMNPVMAEVDRGQRSRAQRRWGGRLQWAAGLAVAAALIAVVAVAFPRLGHRAELASGGAAAPAASPHAQGPGVEAATSGAVPLEIQANSDYDAARLEMLADSSARTPDEGTLASSAKFSVSGAPAEDAAACLAKPGGLSGNDRLVRLIQARYAGTPAYVGVYLESPGPGQPADRIVIWVVAKRDCSILSFSSKRL